MVLEHIPVQYTIIPWTGLVGFEFGMPGNFSNCVVHTDLWATWKNSTEAGGIEYNLIKNKYLIFSYFQCKYSTNAFLPLLTVALVVIYTYLRISKYCSA
jgi:hypothetical protein